MTKQKYKPNPALRNVRFSPTRDKCSGSTWKADSAHEFLKSWIRPQRIEPWPQQHARVESLFVSLFQPTHRLILLPERSIDHRNLRSMRVTRTRALLQLAQQLFRFAPLAGCGVSARKVSHAGRAAPGKLQRILQFGDRLIAHSFLEVRLTQLTVRKSKIWIHFDRLKALAYRFIIRMRKNKKLRQIRVDDKRQ